MHILIADSCKAFRLGIRSVVGSTGVASTFTEAANRSELFGKLNQAEYDVVVVDPLLCKENSQELVSEATQIAPGSNILVFTLLDEIQFGLQAIRAGAKGYLMKNCSSDELVSAVLKVHAGRVYMSETLAEKFVTSVCKTGSYRPHEALTKRESEVFSMLVDGWRLGSIAEYLGLSIKTVSTHKSRIFTKLRCENLSALVQYAIAQKLTGNPQLTYQRM